MLRLTAVIVALLVLFSAATASAGAVPETRSDKQPGRKERHRCLTRDEAEDLRDLWISFFVKISDGGVEARNSVTDDFKLFSESTNAVTPGRSLPVCTALPRRLLCCRSYITAQLVDLIGPMYNKIDRCPPI